ncbi:uncharacterized protein [Nicotiana sylvestris]|uniref:uncharacterized protein n=1 Tax=Nicotiana sylvestris TaxID=4096 RepID=UPI00388CDA30
MIKRILNEEPESSVLVHLNNENLERMTNPQDNPGTPPPPTPSDSSTTPQPRRRQVKMLARKTVATSALSRKLNAQLKASQAQDSQNFDDSYKSVSEGEGTGSSDSEQVTSMQNPLLRDTSRFSEKVGDSYNPKKKETPKTKTLGTARANKKRNVASSETTETHLPKGGATRSKLKQSEEEL